MKIQKKNVQERNHVELGLQFNVLLYDFFRKLMRKIEGSPQIFVVVGARWLDLLEKKNNFGVLSVSQF